MSSETLELYEYIMWSDTERGLFTYATGLVSARNLQEAAEKSAAELQHTPIKPSNAYISVRKWGLSAPVIWHE